MRRRCLVIAFVGASLATGACAPTSFAPPKVELSAHASPTLQDGIADVDAFIVKYRVYARSAANGRQFFEVPAFVAALGAVTATAFGAGPDVTLGSGAAGALLGGGKAYYAPKTKAEIYASAYGALMCIQQVALGVKPFADAPANDLRNAFVRAQQGDHTALYYLVRNAALSVERILMARLSNVGSLADAEGIAAQYQKIVKEKLDNEKAAHAQAASLNARMALGFDGTAITDAEDDFAKIKAMQPDLQLCVLRAKT